MGLPEYASFLANLTGPEGGRGPAGTFKSASAIAVPSTSPASAEITGEEGENLLLRIPRGLPGLNGVPTDEALGEYLGTEGTIARAAAAGVVRDESTAAFSDPASDVAQAAAGLFPVYRLYDEETESYPDRVEGARNWFVGPVDPGLQADPVYDKYLNTGATSMATVIAALLDTGSPLFAAAQFAGSANDLPLTLAPAAGSGLERVAVGSSPNRVFGWKLPDGVTSALFDTRPIPLMWSDIRVRVRWMQLSGGSGNARLYADVTPISLGVPPVGLHAETSQPAPADGVVRETVFSGSNPVTPGGSVTVTVGRLGGTGADSYTGDIVFLEARVGRQA